MTSLVGDRVTSPEVPRSPTEATADSIDDSVAGDMVPISASNGFNAYIFIHTQHTDNNTQESLANAKVSARQPWYIGHYSLNHPSLVFFTVTPSTTNIAHGLEPLARL